MKINRTYSIDQEIIKKLQEHGGNTSALIESLLEDYFRELDGKEEIIEHSIGQLEAKQKELEKQKENIKHKEERAKEMDAEGISKEKLIFLKAMPTHVMTAKDTPKAWENKFGEKAKWSELLKLKRKWA